MRIPRTRDFLEILPTTIAKAELRPSERLIWADRAIKGTGVRRMMTGAVTGVAFSAFSVFWMAAAFLITSGRDDDVVFSLFPWFGLPFLFVGVGMIVMPIWRIGLPPPVYALTSQRLIVFSGQGGRSIRSIDLAGIGNLQRVERPDGSGDIVLGQLGSNARDTLDGVPNVHRVAAEIEDVRALAAEEKARAAGEAGREP